MTAGEALFALICLTFAVGSLIGAVMYRRRGDLFSWVMLAPMSLVFTACAWLAVTS